MPTDVEISRALNALSTTLRDQRPAGFEAARVEQIVTGALGGEEAMVAEATGPATGELHIREDGRLVAAIRLADGQWTVERKLHAGESSWALPQPAYDEQRASAQAGES